MGLLIFSLYNAQLSKIAEIDRIYSSKGKEIYNKYKKVRNEERKLEEEKINNERLDGYEVAIKHIQKDDPQINSEDLKKDFTKLAEYETGITGFRKLIAQDFDSSAITDTDGTLRTVARFLVDEKGNVSNITAEGSNREFNLLTIITLYKTMNKGKWKPAELNGVPIQSIFAMPLTMQFE